MFVESVRRFFLLVVIKMGEEFKGIALLWAKLMMLVVWLVKVMQRSKVIPGIVRVFTEGKRGTL